MVFNKWFYSEGFRQYYFIIQIKNDKDDWGTYYGWSLGDYNTLQFGNRFAWEQIFATSIFKKPNLHFENKRSMLVDLFTRIK
jgi:hypothetical protein